MKIENENYRVEIIEAGGEIQSFYDKKNGIEFMWQGSDEFWKGKNPSLFPLVGNTYSKEYVWNGKTYAMKNHGLIRYLNLQCVSQSEDTIVMESRANEETLAQYPFDYTFQIAYTLRNNALDIVYTITNNGDDVMPFSFGLHPGFNVPLLENEKFEDYKVVFANPEKMNQIVFHNVDQVHEESVEMREWQLNYADFEKYATLVYRDVKSPYVELCGPAHKIRVTTAGYPFFAIWTAKKDAPFLCLEPWYGHADFEKVDVPFEKREGTICLSPKKKFTTSYTISLF